MKTFILKILLFCILISLSFVCILTMADGYTDQLYINFTTPKQNNLIIGTSKAAQGLQPKVFEKIINKKIYNYSFTLAHSPFGSVYLKSILKKLKKDTKDATFIITVDPLSISSDFKFPNDTLLFQEKNLCLANTQIVNKKPNFQYLFNNLSGKYYQILCNQSLMFLHDDGWLEVTINMDASNIKNRRANLINGYKNTILPKSKFSKVRLEYLNKTIECLNQHGKVYLVRLPIHPQMLKIETEFMPDFEAKIKKAKTICSAYLDMTYLNDKLLFTDGNHLSKTSGQKVSKIIAEWINDNKQN